MFSINNICSVTIYEWNRLIYVAKIVIATECVGSSRSKVSRIVFRTVFITTSPSLVISYDNNYRKCFVDTTKAFPPSLKDKKTNVLSFKTSANS